MKIYNKNKLNTVDTNNNEFLIKNAGRNQSDLIHLNIKIKNYQNLEKVF